MIDDEIADDAKDTFERISKVSLVEWNHANDPIPIMFKAQPKTEWTTFIPAYKNASLQLIKSDFPRVKPFLWKEMFWFKNFCLLTTNKTPIEVMKKYIQNQGNNHK